MITSSKPVDMKLAVVLILMGVIPCISSLRYSATEVSDRLSYDSSEHLSFRQLNKTLKEKGYTAGTLEEAAEAAESSCKSPGSLYDGACVFMRLPEASAKCNREGYSVLAAAYVAAFDTFFGRDLGMIPNYVDEAFERHGQLCRPKYMQRFEELAMEQQYIKAKSKVDRIFSPGHINRVFPVPSRTPGRYEDKLVTMTDRIRTVNVQSRLISALGIDWKLKAGKNYHRFYSKNLGEPCESYYSQVADIFLSARLDLALDDQKLSEINPDNREDFNDAWIKFRVCSAVMHSDLVEAIADVY